MAWRSADVISSCHALWGNRGKSSKLTASFNRKQEVLRLGAHLVIQSSFMLFWQSWEHHAGGVWLNIGFATLLLFLYMINMCYVTAEPRKKDQPLIRLPFQEWPEWIPILLFFYAFERCHPNFGLTVLCAKKNMPFFPAFVTDWHGWISFQSSTTNWARMKQSIVFHQLSPPF